jgi:hypothetical protein
MNTARLVGWTPMRILWRDARPVVEWCHLNQERFKESFFEQTIGRAVQHPFNQLFRHQTHIDALGELQDLNPGLPPTGFIFHMSRCGSTLISQTLAALSQNIVISEAPPIDSVIRANFRNPNVTDDERLLWLRWMVSALGQQRHAEESNFFIKYDSWHTLELPLIARAFPEVPWIFVYREPVEVMVSHVRQRGGQMLPGWVDPRQLGLDLQTVSEMNLDEYCARVLARFCEAVLQFQAPGMCRFINYNQLPEVFFASLLDFFGVHYDAAEIARMRHVTQYNAKIPSFYFSSDTETKRLEAPELVRRLAAQWVAPLYEQLEAKRPDSSKAI